MTAGVRLPRRQIEACLAALGECLDKGSQEVEIVFGSSRNRREAMVAQSKLRDARSDALDAAERKRWAEVQE